MHNLLWKTKNIYNVDDRRRKAIVPVDEEAYLYFEEPIVEILLWKWAYLGEFIWNNQRL